MPSNVLIKSRLHPSTTFTNSSSNSYNPVSALISIQSASNSPVMTFRREYGSYVLSALKLAVKSEQYVESSHSLYEWTSLLHKQINTMITKSIFYFSFQTNLFFNCSRHSCGFL